MTSATMTNEEFEKWWEGLGVRERDAETAKCLGLNVVAMDWPCGYDPEYEESEHYEACQFPDNPLTSHLYDEQGPIYVERPDHWPPKVGPDGQRRARVEPVPFYHRDASAMLFLLDYASAHKPLNGRHDEHGSRRVVLISHNDFGKSGYYAHVWHAEAEADTGPAAVQKAFVKAFRVKE
ncbi:MAG: hypothetical protein AB1760_00060 [Pseudomonadota bacterium]